MRVKRLTLALPIAVSLAGCGGDAEPRVVPDVRGERLDVAEEHLDDAGLAYEEIGGGTFGIVVRSRWRVCDQEPQPGRRATEVRLIVGRHCPMPPGASQCDPPPRVPPVVPDVVGEDVDDAERLLAAERIAAETYPDVLDPPAKRLWEVCDQEPDAGERAWHIELYVERSCAGY
jgi:hypothetical protein